MKKLIFGFSFSVFLFSNAIAAEATAEMGKAIFEAKGCALCHKAEKELIGPSMRKIATSYMGKESELVTYLSSSGTPIIYPERASVMNPQLAKIKTLSDSKTKSIALYLVSAADRPVQR